KKYRQQRSIGNRREKRRVVVQAEVACQPNDAGHRHSNSLVRVAERYLDHVAASGRKRGRTAFQIELPATQEGLVIAELLNAWAALHHRLAPDSACAGVVLSKGVAVAQPEASARRLRGGGGGAGKHAAGTDMLADEI